MQVFAYDDYEDMSQAAAALLARYINQLDHPLICAATGHSTQRAYELLPKRLTAQPKLIGLDEWTGLAMHHPASAAHQLRRQLVDPLDLTDYFLFDGTQPAQQEAGRAETYLRSHGPIDISILGIGINGHLGFNEPADFLQAPVHEATLSAASREHAMIRDVEVRPNTGITLGMRAILQSRKIVLLVSGPSKRNIMRRLLNRQITTKLPASFLWLHPDVTCIGDHAALG